MREAVRRPTLDGVLDTEIRNSLALVLDSPAIFGSLYPPIIPPRDPAHSAGPTRKNPHHLLFRIQNRIQNFNRCLKAFWLLKCFKKPPKIHSKSTQKSIKILIDFFIEL